MFLFQNETKNAVPPCFRGSICNNRAKQDFRTGLRPSFSGAVILRIIKNKMKRGFNHNSFLF